MVNGINYDKIGNVGGYSLQEKQSKFVGILPLQKEYSNLVLKAYQLLDTGESNSTILGIKDISTFLLQEFQNKKLPSKSGLGFLIQSKNFLNVLQWDNECPIVLINNLYGINSERKKINKLDPQIHGAFCVWELAIVEHERKAWLNYLASQKQKQDKIKYLGNRLVGVLK